MPLTYPTAAATYIPSTEPPTPVSWVDIGPDVLGQELWDYLVERNQRPFPINRYVTIRPAQPLIPPEPTPRVIVAVPEEGAPATDDWPQPPTD